MSRFQCPVCEYTYDERAGEPREGFPPGTAWAGVPDTWCCPDCGVREKVDFAETVGGSLGETTGEPPVNLGREPS